MTRVTMSYRAYPLGDACKARPPLTTSKRPAGIKKLRTGRGLLPSATRFTAATRRRRMSGSASHLANSGDVDRSAPSCFASESPSAIGRDGAGAGVATGGLVSATGATGGGALVDFHRQSKKPPTASRTSTSSTQKIRGGEDRRNAVWNGCPCGISLTVRLLQVAEQSAVE